MAHRQMNVKIGTVVAQFLFWECLFPIFGIVLCSVPPTFINLWSNFLTKALNMTIGTILYKSFFRMMRGALCRSMSPNFYVPNINMLHINGFLLQP